MGAARIRHGTALLGCGSLTEPGSPDPDSVPPDLTQSEQRFVDYLNAEGYSWEHEPDYRATLSLPRHPTPAQIS